MTDNSLTVAMTQATSGWYTALCQGLQLDSSKFQLAQGNGVPFGTTSDYLWTAMDAIPPYSATNNWGASRNMFSSGYGQILQSLQDPPEGEFEQSLGDNYDVWQQYLKTYAWQPSDTSDSVFRTWAQRYYPPSQIDALVDEMDQDTPITSARTMWAKVGTSGTKAYIPSYEMVADSMKTAPAAKVTYASSKSTSSFQDTWAQGSAELYLDLFGGKGDASFQQTSLNTFSGSITIDMTIAHALAINVEPLYQTNSDPSLAAYSPWYDSAVLSQAYRNQSNQDEIWDTEAETSWADAFGSNGFMRYITTGIFIVDGVNMTMTVTAGYDQQDQTNISAQYESGMWPFFFSQGNAGAAYQLNNIDSTGFTVTFTSLEGNYLILGANVEDTATALGS
jgi:hypothetical protein